MQLDEDGLAEDSWLRHAVGMALNTHRHRTLEKPQKIGLAVSGGSDSMAMLHLFVSCAEEFGLQLYVCTVDHGLRSESADEATFVADTCATLGVSHQTVKWTGWNGKGNLQAMAREARYGLLANWSIRNGLATVALGHTLDDEAETFLARLARGSGLDGLSAMDSRFDRNGATFTRPCLSLERDMLRRYLTRHSHDWRDDPSNEDDKYQRVKIREALKVLAPLGIDKYGLSHAAHNLSQARQALEATTAQAAKDLLVFEGADVTMDWVDFSATSFEIQRRLIMALLKWISGLDYAPRADAVRDLLISISRRRNRTLSGCFVTISKHDIASRQVRITRELKAVQDQTCLSDQIWDTRWQLDGPHAPDLEIRALGPAGLLQCVDWRAAGLPRTSLLASPAIWRGEQLIAAPLAKLNPEWRATLVRGEKEFFSDMVPH